MAYLLAASAVLFGAPVEAQEPPPDVLDQLLEHIPDASALNGKSGEERAELLAPCANLTNRLYYCLGLGFRDSMPDYSSLLAASDDGTFAPTGDKPFAQWVAEVTSMRDDLRVNLFRQEVAEARAGLKKAEYVQKMLEGPWRASNAQAPKTAQRAGSIYFAMMSGYDTKQNDDNWCGPATMQMIEWASTGSKETQSYWAGQLGTTPSGTSISSMVSKTNSATTWDNAAGTYIVQSVSSWSSDQFWNAHMSHIASPAPVIEHPELLETYYPYLDHNGDGHFQVGRGYQKADGNPNRFILIFEPWNEADWWVGGGNTAGPRAVLNSSVLAATKANSFENIGI